MATENSPSVASPATAPVKPPATVVSPIFADKPQSVPVPVTIHPGASPGTPRQTENEPPASKPVAAKTGLREKIRRATAGVISRAGQTFTKGRGRPRNCEECGGAGCDVCAFSGKAPGKLDVPVEGVGEIKSVPALSPPSSLPADSPMADSAPDSLRASIFRRSVVSAARSVIKILMAIVRVYAGAAEIDPVFTEKALARCEPSGEALDRWTESLDVVLKKHRVEPKHAEEISLVVNTVELFAPFGFLLAEFKGEIRRRREKENAE